MSEQISVTLNVRVVSGPGVSFVSTLEVDAYDKLDVDIEAGAADIEVQLQPGDAELVDFLLIKPDRDGLTYKLADPAADPIPLDAPVFLMGQGAISLLGVAPQTLFFSNGLTEDAGVQVLIGRKVTPPPP